MLPASRVAFRFIKSRSQKPALSLCITLSLLLFASCSQQDETLFRLVPPEESGLDFVNTVEEKDSINILTVQYMYHGGAVAAGDFNNDNLTDIFFSGNMVPNRLYLNRGNLKFEDVTEKAGVGTGGKWNSGVALVDINKDGLLDIYVCATIKKDSSDRANMFFINKGIDADGVPTFRDEAPQYGVADSGYSQNAAFLDYDMDGDMDLYVLTNLESDLIPSNYRPRIMDGSALNNDRLYRNNGDGTFTNVTREAGILIEGYGLGIGIADFNNDRWPDIYIGNDYVSNDILYINNRDGTFTNEIESRLKHQSLFSMGIDIADINNDELPDIVTLDMLPENNLRRKTVSGAGATYYNYINNRQYGYEFQYMRNMLQLNNGDGVFSEIGQMSGIHQTEWSWTPLCIDIDNDGYRDLLITNGFPKDVTDRDYVMFKREVGVFSTHRSLIDSIPVLKIPNYAFRNNGDLTFTDVSREWGMVHPSFSNGAAFADLDNDGDLDYVINNINDAAFLYENTLYDEAGNDTSNGFIRIRLTDKENNRSGSGVKVTIRYDSGKVQFHEHSVYRGYLSTVEDVIHFGLGTSWSVDTLAIEWPDGNRQALYHVDAGQVLSVDYSEYQVARPENDIVTPAQKKLFSEVSKQLGIGYRHNEWDKVDFYRQRTLPHKFSQAGPALAVGDVNGDGLEDFISGKSALHDAVLFLHQPDGFKASVLTTASDRKFEDAGLLLFDADNDGDLDLYAVSGSYEFDKGDERHQDRLYRNDGKGNFSWDEPALPQLLASGSCVRAADYDRDGDLDLFVGGRVVPGAYPMAAESYILRNNNGKFENVTGQVCADLQKGGMITDALWSDYNNDGKIDLIVVGELMPVTIYENNGAAFVRVEQTGIETCSGIWSSITGADFDKDGDTDYVVGNIGLNNYYHISDAYPLRVYAKDMDMNGSIDAILSCYFKTESGEMAEYPVHFWDELYQQSPLFRNQFSSYRQYGLTDMKALLKPYDVTGMQVFTVNYAHSSYVENKGEGRFAMNPLPARAQFSPINGMVAVDVNGDGNLDVLAIGNDYGNEVFSGRFDAGEGIVLLGDGGGTFSAVPSRRSGFLVGGDAKALARIQGPAEELFVATQNLDSLRIFRRAEATRVNRVFNPRPDDSWADLSHEDGRRERIEFYYGSGYLSQSTRRITIPEGITQMVVHDFSGKARTVERTTATLVTKD
ncbi:MAG TPA: VCBS repeat-containing protein [Cyclobacteriaceae bacterium]